MLATDIRAWTDVNPDTRFRNAAPNVIISADAIANGEYDSLLGDVFIGGFVRWVIYDDGTNKRLMGLTLYVHPAGAGPLAIDPAALAATNHNGRLLGEDGAYVGNAEELDDIAGALLSHYTATSSFIGSTVAQQPNWDTSLAEGDAIWLVRCGDYDLKPGAAGIADGDPIVSDESSGAGTPDGHFRGAVTLSAPPVLAELEERWNSYAGRCIGIYKGGVVSVINTLARCKLMLPNRVYR